MRQQTSAVWTLFGVLLSACVLSTGCGEADELGEDCFGVAECRDGLLCVAETSAVGPGQCRQEATKVVGSVYTDPVTKLQWQATPTVGLMDWGSAVQYCENLDLDGDSWRLPTVDELRSLIRACPATEFGGPCKIAGSCLSFDNCETAECAGCETDSGPAGGCYWPDELEGSCSPFYWSSSTVEEAADRAFYVIFSFAHVSARTKDFFFGSVRCVR